MAQQIQAQRQKTSQTAARAARDAQDDATDQLIADAAQSVARARKTTREATRWLANNPEE